MVHDGSCFHPIQVVAPATLTNYQDEILRVTAGCSLVVHGHLVRSEGKNQPVEIQADEIEIAGWVENPDTYPISPKPHSLEYLRRYAHLRPRTNVIGAVARVRNTLAQAIHRFFHERDFLWIHTPILTSNDCEGAGEMFRVSTLDLLNLPQDATTGKIDFTQDFFSREVFLTVSGQLNLEAYCCALSNVYTFGPTFRAENSNTSRHLAEFWMIEPEMAFATLEEDAQLAEALLKRLCQALLDERQDDLEFFQQRIEPTVLMRLQTLLEKDFVQMEYSEVIQILQSCGESFEYPVRWGADLQSEHERYLTEKHTQCPVVVKNYPKEIKAFYMRQNEDGKTVAAMDLLAPGVGELIGGSQREERLDVLDLRLSELGIAHNDYGWYRDLRRYGTVPHAGFGLGFERLVAYVTGMANVRDVIPFPRTPGHADY
jgi:asparaginyl-tRNA synthetase